MVKILVAKLDIDPGIPLDDSNVGFREWPKENAPEGCITRKEEFAEHALKIRVSPNMPVLLPYLGPKGQVGISSMIPKGMTLVTLPVDSTQTHSGLLRAGSYVTVSCVVDRPGREGRVASSIKTVLKRVKVIAVGDKIAGTDVATKEANAVKVENISFVTYPRQAMLLNLAKVVSNGRMQFAMLGEEDKSVDDTQDLDEASLAKRTNELFGDKGSELLENPLNIAKPEPVSKVRPTGSSFSEYLKQQPVAPQVAELGKNPSRPTWRVEIYSGSKKEVHEHELPEEPVAAPTKSPDVSEQWTAPLMKFFSRKRSSKQEIQETQSTPADDMRTDRPSEKSAARSSNLSAN